MISKTRTHLSVEFDLHAGICVCVRVKSIDTDLSGERFTDRLPHSCGASPGFVSSRLAASVTSVWIPPLSPEESRCCSISGQYIRVMPPVLSVWPEQCQATQAFSRSAGVYVCVCVCKSVWDARSLLGSYTEEQLLRPLSPTGSRTSLSSGQLWEQQNTGAAVINGTFGLTFIWTVCVSRWLKFLASIHKQPICQCACTVHCGWALFWETLAEWS